MADIDCRCFSRRTPLHNYTNINLKCSTLISAWKFQKKNWYGRRIYTGEQLWLDLATKTIMIPILCEQIYLFCCLEGEGRKTNVLRNLWMGLKKLLKIPMPPKSVAGKWGIRRKRKWNVSYVLWSTTNDHVHHLTSITNIFFKKMVDSTNNMVDLYAKGCAKLIGF